MNSEVKIMDILIKKQEAPTEITNTKEEISLEQMKRKIKKQP